MKKNKKHVERLRAEFNEKLKSLCEQYQDLLVAYEISNSLIINACNISFSGSLSDFCKIDAEKCMILSLRNGIKMNR